MKKTIKLYRPVGKRELELIAESGFTAFPPRLVWQPFFYPVMNFEYAAQIAKDWNTPSEMSGYCGFVTTFDVDAAYVSKFDIQNVGGFEHNELWVSAEELVEFNQHIIGKIEVLEAFYGEKYEGERPLSISNIIH